MRQQGATLLSGYMESNIPGRPIFSCWNATANWLTKNQKAAADFVAAIQQANDLINNQPGQFRAYLGKTTKMAPKVIQVLSLPSFTTDMSNADVTEWEAAAHKYGILTGGAVDPAEHLGIDLKSLRTAEDCWQVLATVLAAIASGEITPAGGARIARRVRARLRAIRRLTRCPAASRTWNRRISKTWS